MMNIIYKAYNRIVTIYRNFSYRPYISYTYNFLNVEWRPRYFNGD
jgi:hypothetical protein